MFCRSWQWEQSGMELQTPPVWGSRWACRRLLRWTGPQSPAGSCSSDTGWAAPSPRWWCSGTPACPARGSDTRGLGSKKKFVSAAPPRPSEREPCSEPGAGWLPRTSAHPRWRAASRSPRRTGSGRWAKPSPAVSRSRHVYVGGTSTSWQEQYMSPRPHPTPHTTYLAVSVDVKHNCKQEEEGEMYLFIHFSVSHPPTPHTHFQILVFMPENGYTINSI